MIGAVIFDMDGVICHTNPDHCIAFKNFFKKRNMFFTEEDYAEHMYGKNNSYIMSHFFGRKISGAELQALEDEKEGMFRQIYKDKVKPISGFKPWIGQLMSNGLKLAVGTSAPRPNLELISNALSLSSKMEVMMSSEDVSAHKPNPEIYLKIAKKLNVKPNESVVFEDSYSGISAAINAGMKVVGVLSSHKKEELPPCDFYINTYKDIQYRDLETM